MAFRVKPSENVKQNARDILAWLRDQQAGEAGLRWFQGLAKAIRSLRDMPARCAIAPEDQDFPFEVRQLLYGRRPHAYRILFTIKEETVTVLHIRMGGATD